jgi:KaiC/GvpD/RAD55 family RecA-like ATPase
MFTAAQTFAAGSTRAPELPRIIELAPLYALGCDLPAGEVTMIAGRSGSWKSGFGMFLCYRLGLPTLYLAADMSPTTVAYRLAAMATGHTTKEVAQRVASDEAARSRYAEILSHSPIHFAYDSPITWDGLDEILDAYVEIWDAFPQVVVFDNFMDIAGASAEYAVQMDAMQTVTELCADLGATVLVLHHATDKGQSRRDPFAPPTRAEVKGGLSEKPALSLSVALVPDTCEYRIAVIKNRHGKSDPMADHYATLWADPERNRFYPAPPVAGQTHTFTREF